MFLCYLHFPDKPFLILLDQELQQKEPENKTKILLLKVVVENQICNVEESTSVLRKAVFMLTSVHNYANKKYKNYMFTLK